MLNKYANDCFFYMNSDDLLELLVCIENIYIEFRDDLVYDSSNLTFGLEIEYENVKKFLVTRFLKNKYKNWNSISDNSLKTGGEIVSPILSGRNCQWNVIEDVAHLLKVKNADTCNSAGIHIHVGRQIITTKEQFIALIKLYIISEPILFRFGYGDKISARSKIMKYSPPVAFHLYTLLPKLEKCNSLEEIYLLLEKSSKYSALNFSNINSVTEKKTMEYRFFNSTSNKCVIQNDINAIINLVLSVTRDTIDLDLLNNYINSIENFEEVITYKYNEICLEDALYVVDQIFTNNLDKLYFLKQYIKGFQNNFGMKNAIYAKKISK